MTTPTDSVTSLYFTCSEINNKRALANLFRFPVDIMADSPALPALEKHYQKFSVKFRKLKRDAVCDFDFFRSHVFGTNYGPMVTCHNDKPASVSLVLADGIEAKAIDLTAFLCKLDDSLELVCDVYESNQSEEKWLFIKKPRASEVQYRTCNLDNPVPQRHQCDDALDSLRWLQEGLNTNFEQLKNLENHFQTSVDKIRSNAVSDAGVGSAELLNRLSKTLSKHDIQIDENDYNPSDYSTADELIDSILQYSCPECLIHYPEVSGGWDEGHLLATYADLLSDFCAKSGVAIKDLKLEHPVNLQGEEDPYINMSICFKHNGRKHRWIFNIDTETAYFRSFSEWVLSVRDGGYLTLDQDSGKRGYLLSNALVSDLEKIGIKSDL